MSLEDAFHERLLEAVAELRKYTRIGLRDTAERVQKMGGLKAAKELFGRAGRALAHL